jgi:pimeloyl-ACP methyl ester carboxylesterase
MKKSVMLHDGNSVEIEVTGDGPDLILPVNPIPIEGVQADAMRRWGADPALGRNLIDGLVDVARVIAVDYEGHVLSTPKPTTLTLANLVADVLAIADAAGAGRFAWYGFSWLGVVGLQLAIGTDRLTGVAIGGWPPIDAPYTEMLKVTTAGWELATGARQSGGENEWADAYLEPDQQRQFVTLYEELRGFDDRPALERIPAAIPKVCFVGANDEIEYGPSWGDVVVNLAQPVIRGRDDLERLGWEVHVLEGLDHTGAMQAPAVLPILRPWLGRVAAAAAQAGATASASSDSSPSPLNDPTS